MRFGLSAAVLIAAGCIAGCKGNGVSGSPSTAPAVTLSWAPNHEKGVNALGGGYQVSISGQPTINLPYTSGPAAPTSTVVTLPKGTYTVSVRAYAALDTQGGSAGSISMPSQSVTVNVP